MDDVRGDFLGPPHGTTPEVVIANIKLRSSKSSEHIEQNEHCNFATFNRIVDTKTSIKTSIASYNAHDMECNGGNI